MLPGINPQAGSWTAFFYLPQIDLPRSQSGPSRIEESRLITAALFNHSSRCPKSDASKSRRQKIDFTHFYLDLYDFTGPYVSP
jgi:hypothetical protein